PLAGLLTIVIDQAVRIGQQAQPWVEQNIGRAGTFEEVFELVFSIELLQPYREQVVPKLGSVAAAVGGGAVTFATSLAREAAMFFVMLFIALYAMYFFLSAGRRVLDKML